MRNSARGTAGTTPRDPLRIFKLACHKLSPIQVLEACDWLLQVFVVPKTKDPAVRRATQALHTAIWNYRTERATHDMKAVDDDERRASL